MAQAREPRQAAETAVTDGVLSLSRAIRKAKARLASDAESGAEVDLATRQLLQVIGTDEAFGVEETDRAAGRQPAEVNGHPGDEESRQRVEQIRPPKTAGNLPRRLRIAAPRPTEVVRQIARHRETIGRRSYAFVQLPTVRKAKSIDC